MYSERGEAKNDTQSATSLGVPKRFRGMEEAYLSLTSSGRPAVMSVSIKPGATALTLTDRPANSLAADFVKPMIPAFAAE